MILDDFCNKVTEDYLREQGERFYGFENPNGFYMELQLGDRIEYANDAYSTLQELRDIMIPDCFSDLMQLVRKEMEPSFSSYQRRIAEVASKRNQALEALSKNKSVLISDAERRVRDKEQELFSSMQNIISKHSSIPREKLKEIISLYKLPVGKSKIDTNKMSLEELEQFIDLAHYAANETVGDKSVTDRLIGIFYLPLTANINDADTVFMVKVSHFLVLLILGYLLKPYFMALVGFVYIVHFLSKLHKIYQREELLCAAYEISEPIDFSSFVNSNEEYIRLKEELDSLMHKDDSELRVGVEKAYLADMERLQGENPQIELEEIQKVYNLNLNEYMQAFEKSTNTIRDKQKNLLRMHEEHIASIDKHFEDLKKRMTLLGGAVSTKKTMEQRFKIGSAKYKGEVVAEADIEMPLTNINFLYKDDESRISLVKFAKLLLCNAICNVKEKYLKVTIYDPNDLGKDFSEFLSPKLSEYIQIVNTDFKKLSESLLSDSKNSIASFGGKDIQTFNAEAESLGKITKDYHIVIIASHEGDLTKEKQFSSFMKYSAKYGVWIWNIMKMKTTFSDNKEDKIDYDSFLKDLCICLEPGLIQTTDQYLGGFDAPLSFYEYKASLGVRTVESLIEAIEENKVDILPYEEGYRLKHIPDDKIWSFNTLKGIELHPGLVDGDPDKAFAHVLGDDTVHALMGGATGQGKSGTINEMLATLLHMYSPEELEMVMVDFKNVEFSMYTGELLIPHAKIIAGTKDGEYALSIFDYLIEEMTRRTKLFTENKVQKIEEYNRLMLAKGRRDLCLPRMLVLIDEFQVMFTEVDDRMVEKIKERITSLSKLARFAGCHMWFTSQSMKNTMSADILEQFKLRLSLFCTKETSTDLLGNPAAATIKGKGWIYTNDSGAQNPHANRLFRVPFATNDYIKTYLPKLIAKCGKEGHIHRNAVFYDESKLHPGTDLIETYTNNKMLASKPGTFILGERTMYSTNSLPYGVTITKDDGEHVISTFFERESLLNVAQTFIENCIQRNVDYCVHSADKESTKLLGLIDRVPDDYKALVENAWTAEELIGLLDNMIQEREEIGSDKPHEEFYFIAVNWEKLLGLGRDDSYKNIENFKSVLQRGGEVNVHVILLLRETTVFKQFNSVINHKIISKCSERESGFILDNDKGLKLDKTFGLHSYGSSMVKFKLYQFPLQGEILKREVCL